MDHQLKEYRMIPSQESKEAAADMDHVDVDHVDVDLDGKRKLGWEGFRKLAAYWILGLCNNYGYVVMLSAANDILHEQETKSSEIISIDNVFNATNGTNQRECNILSTGAILLADIMPALIIKFTAPFLPFYVHVRVAICIVLAASGFLVVAYSAGQWMSITGVVLTSLSSGLGEVTFLQYSAFYDKNVVSTWSSGTGGAGVIGAFSYAALNNIGLQNALLIMLIVPVVMGIAFWGILPAPQKETIAKDLQLINEEEVKAPISAIKKKFSILPSLFKYMFPLGLVYLFEYFINQGMFELINYEGIFLNAKEQYRWLQVDYQIGVFISRSSVNLLHIKHIWLMGVFQLINVFIFTSEAIFYFIPSFYIVLALTLWEGLLGGAAYVNTFYKISSEVPEEERQFSMGVTSFADSIGITLAGVFSIFVHNAICEMPKPQRL